MLAKSIIAGTVLSLMAGGVVYFGTDIDTKAVKDTVVQKTANMKADISKKIAPSDDKAASKSETSVDMPSVKTASGKVIKAKKPTVSHASESESKTSKTAELASSEAPQKKWLDQYLKAEEPKIDVEKTVETEEIIEEKPEIAKDLMESMGLTKEGSRASDTGTYIVEDKIKLTEEQILKAEAEGFEERALETDNIWVEKESSEKRRKKSTRKMLHDIIKKNHATVKGEYAEGEKKVEIKVIANEDGETTIETETIDMGDGKIMKIVKKTVKSEDGHEDGGKKIRIKVITDEDDQGQKIHDKDISETVEMVMTEIQKINKIELRDRAYFSLICFGLDHKNYNVADQALEKIMHPEIRDQARTHIAVAHAKAGQPDEAWDMLDELEIEASRDVMRLEIIEAIIAPKQAPH